MASDDADRAIEDVNDDGIVFEGVISSSQDEIIKETDNGTFTALQKKD